MTVMETFLKLKAFKYTQINIFFTFWITVQITVWLEMTDNKKCSVNRDIYLVFSFAFLIQHVP